MTQYIQYLPQFQFGLFLLFQVALLFLQGAALRRHGNKCFQLLVASTIFGILLLITRAALLVFLPTMTLFVWHFWLTFIFSIAQAVLGLAGAALLFRDYRRLAEHFSNSSTNQTPNDTNA